MQVHSLSETFLFQIIQFCQTVVIQTIQFSLSIVFVHTHLNVKIVLFQVILFNISMQFSSIWPIDRTLSGATTPGPSGPESDGNERVIHIPQSSSITGASSSDCLVSYHRTLMGESLTPLQRSSQCILQIQPTGQMCVYIYIYIYIYLYIYLHIF